MFRRPVSPFFISWIKAFFALNPQLITQHGFTIFAHLQDLALRFGKDAEVCSQLLDLSLGIFTKIQDQALLKEGSVFASFHGHHSSLCSTTLKLLERSSPTSPSPALPSILLLELLGTSGSPETATTILGSVLSHPSSSTSSHVEPVTGNLFSYLANSFSKIHSGVRLAALVSGIKKLHCMIDPVHQLAVLKVIQDQLLNSGDQALPGALVAEWKPLLQAWKSSTRDLTTELPNGMPSTTSTALQVLLLSIAARCAPEAGSLGPAIYDFLEALVNVAFDLFNQRLAGSGASHFFSVSQQLALVRSMVIKVFEQSGVISENIWEGLVSFYCDLLLEKGLEAPSLKSLAPALQKKGDLMEVDGAPPTPKPSAPPAVTLRRPADGDGISKQSLLGLNRSRELTALPRKVTNSIQKKIQVHTGWLKPRPKNGLSREVRLSPPLPSPFHEMADASSRNDLAVQNVSDLMSLFAIFSGDTVTFKKEAKARPPTLIFVDRMRTHLWPGVSFVPLPQYDKILPNRPTFEK